MTSNLEPQSYYDEKAFSKDVIAKWGSINENIKFDENLFHGQMGHLANTIAQFVAKGEEKATKEIFDFLDEVLAKKGVIEEFENAVAISFLDYDEIIKLGIVDQVPHSILQIAKEQKERWDKF